MLDARVACTVGSAPGALPLLGHALAFRRPLDFLASLPAHGDLVRIKLGPWPAYVACHPELAHQILVNDRTFDKGGPIWDNLRDVLGNGLASCPHHDHRRQRRLVQPAFRRERMPGYARVMIEQIHTATERWRDGETLDVLAVMNGLSTAITTRTLFAAEIGESALLETQQCARDMLTGAFRRVVLPLGWLGRLPFGGNRRYVRARERLRFHTGRLVANYRQSGIDHGDLLSTLLAARDDDGQGLADSEVHDQVLTFFIAGSETTSTALSWAWHLLGTHPEIRQRLQAEVDRVLAGRIPTHDDVPKLELTAHIIAETLRLYPPGWISTRRATTDTELAGRHLPAGTVVVFSPYLLHRRADLYPEPDRFEPDRWHAANKPLPRTAYAPFADGARKCIGDTFALVQATLSLASIASRWELEPLPRARVKPALRLTLTPRSLHMRLRQRR